MGRMDAAGKAPTIKDWKKRVSLVLGAIVVLGACMILKYFAGGADLASAQGPARKSRSRTVSHSQPAAGSPAPASRGPSQSSSVAAVVNGQQITRPELMRECLRRFGAEVLETIVNRELIMQACRQQKITITQQAVDDEIVAIANKFGLSADRWISMLENERNITLEQYRRDIVWPTLALRRLAADKLTVTPAELQQALESEYGPKVQVRMISVTDAARAQQLRAQATAKPEDFGSLAKDHSEDPHSAAARGMIPPIRKHGGHAEVERIAFGLQPGQISPVIEVAGQYLILKCEKHLPPVKISAQHRQDAEQALQDRIAEQRLRSAASQLFKQLQEEARVVNVHNNVELQKQTPGVAATINGQRITVAQLSEACLARKGREVLESEIDRLLLAQALQRRNLTVAEADLDAEIARAAEAYGFVSKDGKPNVDAWLKEVTSQEGVTVELYVRDAVWPSVALKNLAGDQVQLTEEDLRKGFAANYGERVEVLAIVLGNQRTAQEVFAMARSNPSRKFFGELAEQYSIEPVSRANFGEVPPIRRFSGQPSVEQEAFSLKPDELSGIVAVGDKFIIMKCLGRTEPIVDQMDAVRDELVRELREKKLRVAMASQFDRLKESAQIDNFLAGTTQSGKRGAASGQARNAKREPPAARPVAPATYRGPAAKPRR